MPTEYDRHGLDVFPRTRVIISHDDVIRRDELAILFSSVAHVAVVARAMIDLEGLQADLLILGPNPNASVCCARRLREDHCNLLLAHDGTSPASYHLPEFVRLGVQPFETIREQQASELLALARARLEPKALDHAGQLLRTHVDRFWWTQVQLGRVVLGLKVTTGNKDAAALLLGISPQHLRLLLRDHAEEAAAIAAELNVPTSWVTFRTSADSGTHRIYGRRRKKA